MTPSVEPGVDAGTADDGIDAANVAGRVALALLGPAVVVALCWLRSPAMMTTGRFWAEDTMFFEHAQAAPTLLGKLAYVYKGHYELFAAASHALAGYASLKFAPLVTGLADLGLEALLAFLIVFFRRDLGLTPFAALAISALLVVSPCASEHYLNALNGQWLASAILFVVVALPERRLAGRASIAAGAAFVLGLTGIASCVLLPVAVLYAAARRSRPHAALAAGLLAACAVQAALVVTHPIDGRFRPASPYFYVVAPFLQAAVKHLMGVDAEGHLAEWFRQGPMATGAFSPFVLLPLGVVAWMARRIRRDGFSETGLLLLTFLTVTLLNEAGAIGDRNDMVGVYAMRYFFLPSLVAALSLARVGAGSRHVALRHAVLGLVLVVSGADFFGNTYNASLVTLAHDWRRQVDACRAGPPGPCRIETAPDGFEVEIRGGRDAIPSGP